MTDKAPDAYRTISEVADDLDLPQHVLRFWETRFSQIRPLKRGGGRRYYRPDDVELLKGIRYLLYSEGYTIKGVQRILKEQGPKAVQTLVQGPAGAAMAPAPAFHPAGPDDGLPDEFEEMLPEEEALAPPPQPPAPREIPVAARPAAAPMPVAALAPVPAAPVPIPPAPVTPDLFARPHAPSVPVPPPALPPVVPPKPAGPPNVSFMRGGLKPIVPAGQESAPAFLVRKPQPSPPAEAPAPRFAPSFDAVEPPKLAAPSRTEALAAPPAGRLSEDQRRALQSALFELSECRRAIDTVSASRDR